MAEDNTPVQRITVRHITMMVNALNAVQDINISPTAKDYDWYSHSGSTQRIYTLTRGGKIVIQGMHVADFYFACNAIAETINDVITEPRYHWQHARSGDTRLIHRYLSMHQRDELLHGKRDAE